ncbi:SDR family oxidoreductase [Enterococcus sp.]|uniref:SDR family oxidoreductase n=1 Tax=Enterococcus sp. TaxID=35783 RepID=UPI00290EA016|nr:NmrA family NAD(P)-binding protein [Enterococcus sp.]MDU5333242.1 NmrA family NAD(P)-binding protein [Enterococcus sp.]
MILVTSAAGNTGRIMVQKLVEAGLDVLATDINPKVKDLPGIKKAVVGDLTDLSFIDALMQEASKVVYIPPLFSAEEALIGQRMVDKAIEHKIEHFVFISVIHPILTSLLQHTAKRDVEEYLIVKGMETQCSYTILQPMHYMHNFNPKMVAETGAYRIFYDVDSKVGYVATEDVGEVAVKVLTDPAKHNKATYELVGTEAYSPNVLVKMFNRITGKNAVSVYIDVEDFLNQIQANDLFFREGFKHLAHSYSTWGLDGNPNVLTWLLGHEPTSFEEYLNKNLNT